MTNTTDTKPRYAVTISTTGPAVTRDGMIISRHSTLDGAAHVAHVLNGPAPIPVRP